MKRQLGRKTLTLALASAAILLAGCTLQLTTAFQPDGSGDLRTEIGFSATDQIALKTVSASVEDFCRDFQVGQGLPEGFTVTVENRGTEVWCVTSVPFADLEALKAMYADMDGVTVKNLALTGDGLTYDVDLTPTTGAMPELGDVQVSILWQVVMPGEVIEHNADKVKGNTLTWDMTTGETRSMHATSKLVSPPLGLPLFGGGTPSWIWFAIAGLCCCGLLGAAAAVVGLVVWRRRRESAPPGGTAA